MMEYIFFDANLRDSFVEFASGLDVACASRDDTMGMVVEVADDLADELLDTLEAHYDELQEVQSSLMSQAEGGFKNMAGFSLVLPDGKITMVPLQPDIANRLLANFTIDEIQALFSKIAGCALEPKERHLCEILRADANA